MMLRANKPTHDPHENSAGKQMKGKMRSEQHLIDADGEQVLIECLPRHWVLRGYRPDYGFDYSIEIFADADGAKGIQTYETLGEHLFIQLKSCSIASARPLALYGRGNVEKGREKLDASSVAGELHTIRQQIDIQELITVHRMGVGVPVLLVVADVSTRQCYFVCLNDYIDKVLVPRFDDWTATKTRTIHVPILNQIATSGPGLVALRWYAKRAKLYAAFQRFVFQAGELEYANSMEELRSLTRAFALRISEYDFWGTTEMWSPIPYYGAALRRLLATGMPGLTRRPREPTNVLPASEAEIDEFLSETDIRQLWKSLALLPRNYEDVCREWFLPTGLGYLSSYSNAPRNA